MKTPALCLPAFLLSLLVAAPAEEPPAKEAAAPAKKARDLGAWGEAVDPAKDCRFTLAGGELTIVVPGSARPHDFSAELGNVEAPRALTPLQGDFKLEVKVDGLFSPGEESTQPGRTGYTGAGVCIVADDDNYVRLERASLQTGGSGGPHPYINFEIRLGGQLVRIGSTGDHKTPDDGPVWLRLERKGREFHGAVKQEGGEWAALPPKELPAAWPEGVKAGVHAVSTSTQVFTPKFSEFKITPQP